jgi:hypothetical protein
MRESRGSVSESKTLGPNESNGLRTKAIISDRTEAIALGKRKLPSNKGAGLKAKGRWPQNKGPTTAVWRRVERRVGWRTRGVS